MKRVVDTLAQPIFRLDESSGIRDSKFEGDGSVVVGKDERLGGRGRGNACQADLRKASLKIHCLRRLRRERSRERLSRSWQLVEGERASA